MEMKERFPRLAKLGVPILEKEGVPYVKWADLNKALDEKKMRKVFGVFFGVQTCFADGPYAGDVEAVLVRLFTGRLVGSQKEWD